MTDGSCQYRRYIGRKRLILLLLCTFLAAVCILSLMTGSAGLSLADVIGALLQTGSRENSVIVWNVRMPRLVTAVTVGMALGLSGCIMQNVLCNPLASASTLGVSQGASFGAALAIVLMESGDGMSVSGPYAVSSAAFCGGMITTLVILLLSRLRESSSSMMVLAGVAISSMFTGGTTLLQYFADDVMVASIVYWTFGSLGRAGWGETALIGVLAAAALLFFIANRWNYNALESGHDTARSLGVNTAVLVPASLAVCALITSVSVAFTGCISFIGLIAPHIVRRFIGNDFRFLIPCSALSGAALLILSDIACRTLASPVVLPVGALTSFLGAPLFLYLILRGRRGR